MSRLIDSTCLPSASVVSSACDTIVMMRRVVLAEVVVFQYINIDWEPTATLKNNAWKSCNVARGPKFCYITK